jgi:hypothetical protein
MAPTSGLVDLFEAKGVLTKSGNKLAYTDKETGEVVAEFRKNWTEDKLHTIMKQWDETATPASTAVESTTEEEEIVTNG